MPESQWHRTSPAMAQHENGAAMTDPHLTFGTGQHCPFLQVKSIPEASSSATADFYTWTIRKLHPDTRFECV
jgi:hypothetical protein